jgi:phosphomannomutase
LPGGEWVAFRASGTEPLIRRYIGAKPQANLKKLRVTGQTLPTT